MHETNFPCVLFICLVFVNMLACGLPDSLRKPTPTPTKTLVPTAAVTPTITPTPTVDIWEIRVFPSYDETMSLLEGHYGEVLLLDVGLQPTDSFFVIFIVADGEMLVAQIGTVEGEWAILHTYLTVEPTATPSWSLDRES